MHSDAVHPVGRGPAGLFLLELQGRQFIGLCRRSRGVSRHSRWGILDN